MGIASASFYRLDGPPVTQPMVSIIEGTSNQYKHCHTRCLLSAITTIEPSF